MRYLITVLFWGFLLFATAGLVATTTAGTYQLVRPVSEAAAVAAGASAGTAVAVLTVGALSTAVWWVAMSTREGDKAGRRHKK